MCIIHDDMFCLSAGTVIDVPCDCYCRRDRYKWVCCGLSLRMGASTMLDLKKKKVFDIEEQG